MGGIKLKGFGKEVSLIKGESIAKAYQKSGADKAIKVALDTKAGQLVKTKVADPIGEAMTKTKQMLGKAFVKNFGKEKELVDTMELAERQARRAEDFILEDTQLSHGPAGAAGDGPGPDGEEGLVGPSQNCD